MTRSLALAAVALWGATAAGSTRPVDCLPDRVQGDVPAGRFGGDRMPGIVLGPPGESLAYQGSLTVASIGDQGSLTVVFDDVVLEDRPGPDFIVFENGFFKLPIPSDPSTLAVAAEPGIVEVSADGTSWHTFPHDPDAIAALPADGSADAEAFAALAGLAGRTPTFTGNWTVADDPGAFDPGGTGGVSGAGGDAFDLADVGLAEARFVRVRDPAGIIGFPGAAEGFDLDAVVALHARPLGGPGIDSDGDGLTDQAEVALYGSDPDDADSDGDGTDDGREVAGCRNPSASNDAPFRVREPTLWVEDGACTTLRWTFDGAQTEHEAVAGSLDAVTALPASVDLGPLECLSTSTLALHYSCDPIVPVPGQARFYLVRVAEAPSFGWSSLWRERSGSGGCR